MKNKIIHYVDYKHFIQMDKQEWLKLVAELKKMGIEVKETKRGVK